MTYVNLTISDTITFVNLPCDIRATSVAVNAAFDVPSDLVYLLSDIVSPQPFQTVLKPILGHIPTSKNCFRELQNHVIREFVIKLEDSEGKPYKVTKAFHIELKFNGSNR